MAVRKDDLHRCHQLACDCPVWNRQRSQVREILQTLPVSKDDFYNQAWLTDSAFWDKHSSLTQAMAYSRLGIMRLAARCTEINDALSKSQLSYCIASTTIPGTHGEAQYFLVTGLSVAEYKARKKK